MTGCGKLSVHAQHTYSVLAESAYYILILQLLYIKIHLTYVCINYSVLSI